MVSAAQWQEAYKSGDLAIAALYAAPCYEWPSSERSNPLTAEAIEEWRSFLIAEGAAPELLTPLDVLRDPAARVVVTGQQAGAGMGPLYTLHKALAARHWAAEYTRATGRPCVPIFWIASDDHDLAEVQVVKWQDGNGQVHAADLHPEKVPANRAVSSVGIDPAAAEKLVADFMASIPATDFQTEAVQLLREALSEATFETAFLRLFCQLLLPLGIIPVVPRLGFIRNAALPILTQELAVPGTSSAIVRDMGPTFAALQAEAPLHRRGDELNFFLELDGIRAKLQVAGGRVQATAPASAGTVLKEFAMEELRLLAASQPSLFSPNAQLRPLVQDVALPSVGYVGGPSEVQYHAQLGPLYGLFRVPRPAVIPRPNVLLLEPKTVRAAAKLGLTPADVAKRTGTELANAGDQQDGALVEYASRAAELRSAAATLVESVRKAERDTGIIKAADKLSSSMDTGLTILMDRLNDNYRRRDGDRESARERLVAFVFPDGEPQERSIGMLAPLLVNHGSGVFAALGAAIDYRAIGMQAIRVADLPNGAVGPAAG